MATVKIKFRASTIDVGDGISYQRIENEIDSQQKNFNIYYESEWNSYFSTVVLPNVQEEITPTALEEISTNVTEKVETKNKKINLFPFMESIIINLRELGKIRISETYTTTLSSFKRFRRNNDIALDNINSDVIIAYEAYLKQNGLCPNSSSFYMRNLRAVYNRAVERGITTQAFPFKHVYTGVDKTIKRAVSLKVIKQIKDIALTEKLRYDFARDIFLFSFYTRGMSFVDIAYLRKKDLSNGILSYRRRKTNQRLFIKWEKCMQEIVDKYKVPQSEYLLPIINPFNEIDERKQYIYAAHKINRCLKIIGEKLNLSIPLTLYVARHAWASIAKNKKVPLSVISEGMGHDSEATTRIYLASLDTVAVDKANSLILKSL